MSSLAQTPGILNAGRFVLTNITKKYFLKNFIINRVKLYPIIIQVNFKGLALTNPSTI